MLIRDALSALERLVPLATAGYEKDAVGVQVGFAPNATLTKALVAHEVTHEVIDEAIGEGANLIVAYHPLIFPNISALTDATRTGALVRRLVKADIALYVLHTAFDTFSGGTSYLLAEALGLQNISAMQPLAAKLDKIVVFVPKASLWQVQEAMWQAGAGHIGNYDECSFITEGIGTFRGNELSDPAIGTPMVREQVGEYRLETVAERWKTSRIIRAMVEAHPYEEVAYDVYPLSTGHPSVGIGSVGDLPEAMPAQELLEHVRSVVAIPNLRHNKPLKTTYKRLAMVGGAGMEYYGAARGSGIDVYLTADIRYHDFYRAEHDGILLIDGGHVETERFVVSGIASVFEKSLKFVNLTDEVPLNIVISSRLRPNAVRYY
jgi:dinuclear metal center YbgI/SA1388 family protein